MKLKDILNETPIGQDTLDFSSMTDEDFEKMVKTYPWMISKYNGRSLNVFKALIPTYRHASLVTHIKDEHLKDPEIQEFLIKQSHAGCVHYMRSRGIPISEPNQYLAVQYIGACIKDFCKKPNVPSERVQQAAVKQDPFAIQYLTGNHIDVSVDTQLLAVNSIGFLILDLHQGDIPLTEPVIRAAFNQMLTHDNGLNQVAAIMDLEPSIDVPDDIKQQVVEQYPKILTTHAHLFPDIVKVLVDNLRSTLTTYSLPTVHKFIEVAYEDDPDMITTMKHRANAIQRKLDERNSNKKEL